MITIRRLTEQGIEKFRDYIHQIRQNPIAQRPDLNISPYSEEFIRGVEVDESCQFGTRLEMAQYLNSIFMNAGLLREQFIGEHGFWTWLTYFWFDMLCPADNNGNRSVKEDARYICSQDYTDYYRHYIVSSYYIYSLHGDNFSRLFLNCPLNVHNDFIEQLASRQFIISHKEIIKVVHNLYWDENNGSPKRGAQAKNRPGNLRRFVKFIQQFELTYDIFNMNATEILQLLPSEFSGWRNV